MINLVVVSRLSRQFTFVGNLAERFTTITLATNRVRSFAAIIDDSIASGFVASRFSNDNFTESKTYVHQTGAKNV